MFLPLFLKIVMLILKEKKMIKLIVSLILAGFSVSLIAAEIKTYMLTEQQMEVVAFVIEDRMKLINEVQVLKKELAREKNKTCL